MKPPPPPELTITEDLIGNGKTPLSDDHDEKYGVPSLEELGFDIEGLRPPVWIGGETEALGNKSAVKILQSHNIRLRFQLVSIVIWNERLGLRASVDPKCRLSRFSPVKLDSRHISASDAFRLVCSTLS